MRLGGLEGGQGRKELAKALGVTVQAIGQVLNGSTRALTAENNERAARRCGVNPFWLATGEETPDATALAQDEQSLLSDYRALPAEAQAMLRAKAREVADLMRQAQSLMAERIGGPVAKPAVDAPIAGAKNPDDVVRAVRQSRDRKNERHKN